MKMECAIAGKFSSPSSCLVNTRRNEMRRTKLMGNHDMFYSSKSMISLPILAHTNPSLKVIPVILRHHYFIVILFFIFLCLLYICSNWAYPFHDVYLYKLELVS